MHPNTEQYDDHQSRDSFRKPKSARRTLLKDDGDLPEGLISGTVTAVMGNSFVVESHEGDCGEVECVAAGTMISSHQRATIIAVGDRVFYTLTDNSGENIGTISRLEERRNVLSRQAVHIQEKEHVIASNIDKLLIFCSASDPIYNVKLIDRYLVTAELNSITPIICVNKTDLFFSKEMEQDFDIYKELGIPVYFLSVKKNSGIEPVIAELTDSVSVLSGPSGAGKSTLLNKVLGVEYQTVQDISNRTSKGMHTTSAARMFSLPSIRCRIIDTPGIREFGIFGLEKEELSLYFHDFDKFAGDCRFQPCTHLHEPGCAVMAALEAGLINPIRYESYLNIYDSL